MSYYWCFTLKGTKEIENLTYIRLTKPNENKE